MKQVSPILIGLIVTFGLAACHSRNDAHPEWSDARTVMEARGDSLLDAARAALGRKDFDGARADISRLRSDCELAFDARRRGILLLDSIELQSAVSGMLAADSLVQSGVGVTDSLRMLMSEYDRRVKFFRRKLQHDRAAVPGEAAADPDGDGMAGK